MEQVRAEFDRRLEAVKVRTADQNADVETVEQLSIAFLGRKGRLAALFAQLGAIPTEERPEAGRQLNQVKEYIQTAIKAAEGEVRPEKPEEESLLDLTLPGDPIPLGTIHPVTRIEKQIKDIFLRLGFSVLYGPEVETEFYNFEALNFKQDHPARDMQDTFYISEDLLLRTHTSNNQIHAMQHMQPPLRIIMPGRVYRNEAISARAYCTFHQIEGLAVDRNISMAELKGTLQYLARELYGPDTRTRFRPSYFPFTEPSAEMDIYWGLETETDYRVTKGTGWLEILGCGMVHPNVLRAVDVDPLEWTGYAFGMGLERIAMLMWGIGDIRYFYEGDLRFLRQF
ncbi:MAG: phenylalanine--tRNA ligase subunit alpha [Fidelibacterota bacterium]|nr:MAG: phenylalanine--tRNA ligase subunit alpha [Candidatus Neomarinimicrobiota bacterium]